jgi:hypothetical protein
MKYFRIDFQNFYNIGRVPSYAEGEKIPNASEYFWRMNQGEIIQNAPIFDYFYLKSFDKEKYWEWKLCDVHGFIGEGSQIHGWLISQKLKSLFDCSNLSKPYFFYPSTLLYKGKKFDYYIFKFTGKVFYELTIEYIDYSKSIFWDPVKNVDVIVKDKDNFLLEYDRIYKENGSLKNIIQNKKLVLRDNLDFFPLSSLTMGDLVSERLKNVIEENEISGFEFSELDYEVVVEK